MKNDNLKTALLNSVQNDIERLETAADHEFSPKFEREMKKLISGSAGKKRTGRMVLKIAAAVAAALATFAVGTFAGAVSSGFTITQNNSKYYYNGFPANIVTYANAEGAPETLETIYTLGKLPDKIALRSTCLHDDKKKMSTLFMPKAYDDNDQYTDELWGYRIINLCQDTKDAFESSFSAANYVSHKELTINGRQAYFITRDHFYGQESSLIWDGGDYIFELLGYFSEETAVELATSLVPFEGELHNKELVEV